MRSNKNYKIVPEVIKPGQKSSRPRTAKKISHAQKHHRRSSFGHFKILIPVIGFAIISGGLLLTVSLASPREPVANTTPVTVIDDSNAYGNIGLASPSGDLDIVAIDDTSNPKSIDAASTDHVECPNTPNDCAALIQESINNNEQRPLHITFSVGDGSKHANFSTEIKPGQDVSISGKDQPLIKLGDSDSPFNLSESKNVFIGDFDIDLNGCQSGIKSVFSISDSDAGQGNIHISNIETNNGDRFYDSSDRLNLLFKEYSDCNFITIDGDSDGVYISNIKSSHMRKFIDIQSGNHQGIAVYSNSIDLTGLGYITQSDSSSIGLMQIASNRFSKFALGKGNNDLENLSLVQTATSSDSQVEPRIQRLEIVQNVFEAPGYKTPSVTEGAETINAQLVPSLATSLVTIGSVGELNLAYNTLTHSAGDGISIDGDIQSGTINDNLILLIDGDDLYSTASSLGDLKIENNVANLNS